MEETAASVVEKWVNEHSDYLFNFAMKKINDKDLALDLIQDTFVAAINGLDGFKGNSAPQTWLVSILNRKIIDHWRKEISRKTNVASHFFRGEGDDKEGFWVVC
jgi:RNA polymerase sigma-70 factor (ECF subfamily)